MRTEQSPLPGDGLNGNDPVRHAGARPLSIKDATETAGRSVTQPPVVINFLTRDEQYVFSTFEVNDEETAEREAAAALEQGVPSYYLVPTGDRYHPWRRVDVGLSPREGESSPWGVIETVQPLADGIVCVHTPSHGGIWLSAARLAQMSPDERSSDGWYEEDCEAAWPLRRFRDEVLHAFPADRLDPYIDAAISFSGGSFAGIAMNRKA